MTLLLPLLFACSAPGSGGGATGKTSGAHVLRATVDDPLPAYAPAVTLLAQLSADGPITVGATLLDAGWVDLDAPDDERHGFRYTVRDAAGEALYARSTSGPVIVRDFLASYSELAGADLLGSLPILGRFAFRVPLLDGAATVDLELRTAPGVYEVVGQYDLSLREADDLGLSEAVTGVTLLHDSGPPERRLDIAIVGDGYTADEQGRWERDAADLTDQVLRTPPYADFADRINIHRVDAPSAESGVSYDCVGECRMRDTALGSVFPLAFANQVLGTDYRANAIFQLDQWAATRVMSHAPWDFVLVIANSEADGGFGLHYSTVTNGPAGWRSTGVHELSHVVGQLGDEYTGDVCVQSPALGLPANITDSPDAPPWAAWVESDTPLPTPATEAYATTVGAFSPAYNCDDLYKPSQACIMGDYPAGDFCPVCGEALTRRILRYVDPADDVTVTEEEGGGLRFTVEGPMAGVTLAWTLDGEPISEGSPDALGEVLELQPGALAVGEHTLAVEASLETAWLRSDGDDLRARWQWRVVAER